MLGKLHENHRELFRTRLEDLINPNHELALLANKINWNYFENEFKPYYSDKGAPSVPLRMMVGCLMLKHLYNLGDDRIPEYWIRDVYFQYTLCSTSVAALSLRISFHLIRVVLFIFASVLAKMVLQRYLFAWS